MHYIIYPDLYLYCVNCLFSVVRWSQTADDVTVILHAGRTLKHNDIEVVFSEDKVDVGLTGYTHFPVFVVFLLWATLPHASADGVTQCPVIRSS